ncbi:MAG: hypothetical protein MI974_31960 [Chitinophagales bacterium]|nr:hypothetical protein [Chitinophagales bacterium]
MPRKYKVKSCHTTKTAAKKAQKRLHDAGHTGRLKKSGKRWCVETAGKKKTAKRKKTTRRRRRK